LADLFSSVRYLKGVGPHFAEAFGKSGISTIEDILYNIPRDYTDWSNITGIGDADLGDRVTLMANVISSELTARKGLTIFTALLEDGTGQIVAKWFNQPYLSDVLTGGKRVVVSGEIKLSKYHHQRELQSPSFEVLSPNRAKNLIHTGRIVPEYSQIGPLSSRRIRSIVKSALDHYLEEVKETVPGKVIERLELLPLQDALKKIHFPSSMDEMLEARRRLAFDELFFVQLKLARRKRKVKDEQAFVLDLQAGKKLGQLIQSSVSFELTGAQKRVIDEIENDLRQPVPMNRLLQGDVGSGKTVVAAAGLLLSLSCGYQSAFMAPTEILAEQHFATLKNILADHIDSIRLLTGNTKKKDRDEILEVLASGRPVVVVGTHALIEESVEFERLAYAVVDEQHRFGVLQRASIKKKGVEPHTLVMTATPIPRTLTLTIYGDLDVSILDEIPPGRRPVKTAVRTDKSRERLYQFVREKVKAGRQAFIVYPLIEESEKLELKAATEMYEKLSTDVFPDLKLGLIHGRLKKDEKDRVMNDFRRGELQVLVSTTVIEVGVDVPNATVMFVEHAERFGLAQLHQLRGRVARSSHPAHCILMVDAGASSEALERVRVLEETNDGFKIAEKDLQIRGPGELLGVRQHGLPKFSVADLTRDAALLAIAREAAFRIAVEGLETLEEDDKDALKELARRYGRLASLVSIG
jgi:ATP-dependent DNA helicase RecG